MPRNYLVFRYFFYFLKKSMIATLILQLKVFLFILSILVLLVDIFHVISVFKLKSGKLATQNELIIFGVALSYILTMIICGF